MIERRFYVISIEPSSLADLRLFAKILLDEFRRHILQVTSRYTAIGMDNDVSSLDDFLEYFPVPSHAPKLNIHPTVKKFGPALYRLSEQLVNFSFDKIV